MKKRNLNFLLALLAALALVFAGACSDDPDDASGTDVIAANATAIGALLDAIDTEVGSGITDVAWAFKAGAASTAASGWNAGSATYTLMLASGDSQGGDQPVLATALNNLQNVGVVASEDGSIRVLFGAAAAAGDNTAVASNRDDYRLTVPVVIGDDAGTITVVLPYSVVATGTDGWKASAD